MKIKNMDNEDLLGKEISVVRISGSFGTLSFREINGCLNVYSLDGDIVILPEADNRISLRET